MTNIKMLSEELIIEKLAAEYLNIHQTTKDRAERDIKKAELDNIIYNVLQLDAKAFDDKLTELAFRYLMKR